MGYWGTGIFENDDAMDWTWSLEQSTGIEAVERALSIPPDTDYLEAPHASEVLAAAEIVAALLGQPATDLPVDVARWIAEHRNLDAHPLRERSLAQVRKVLGSNSELRELWEENETDFPFWKSTVEALIARLSSAS